MEAFLGLWLFIGTLYQGHFYPPRDPRVLMSFEFFENKTNNLTWYREQNPKIYCSRIAEFDYDIEKNILKQKIIWVDDKNTADCGADPDMQLGAKSEVKLTTKENKMYLDIPVAKDVITFVWDKKL